MGGKVKNAARRAPAPVPADNGTRKLLAAALPAACTALYFLAVCLISASTVKIAAMTLSVLTLASAFLFFSRLRGRVGAPLLFLGAFVLMGGVSTLYAVSGKFALYEFLKLLASLCLGLLLMTFAPERGTGRWIAKVLAGFSAVAGVVSIDLISTRFFSGAVIGFLSKMTPDYQGLGGVEAGVRMTSIYENPNVFAGVAGLGVLLSLGLVSSSETAAERRVQTAVLYCNSLAFLLAFSMGASGAIAVAFVVLLLLERRDGRVRMLILMVETLICTVAAAAVISVTSFGVWEGVRPVPILCTVLGAAALCASDALLGGRIAGALSKRGKIVPAVVAAALAAVAVFAVAAYNLTGPAALGAGEGLRRASYPDAGAYTLTVEADGPVYVTIESQDRQDTMVHTSSVIYSGDASGAAFQVPEGSLVVYFNFSAPQGAALRTVAYSGPNGSGQVPLGYRLLPGFMANRLQGLWANENAIQRLVFFADGLKLFKRSPVYGLGLGAFENGIKSVQSFAYVTKYAHNHYIQTLAETGVIGLLLFLLLLGVSAAAVILERKRGEAAHPLTPALGAALAYMAGHAATEVVFSAYPYLPIAFGTFVLVSLCCGGALPGLKLKAKGQTVSVLTFSAFIAVYCVLLGGNLRARAVADAGRSFEALDEAITLDKFEWADYALSYVESVAVNDVPQEIKDRADKYAQRLEQVDSNSIPIGLAEYYFNTGRTEKAIAMVEKYVDYVSSDAAAWQRAFDLLLANEKYTDVYRAGVQRVAAMLERWNAENLGTVTLSDEAMALIERTKAG